MSLDGFIFLGFLSFRFKQMGALTSNHKRDHPYPYSISPEFHISKKPRFSSMHQTPNQTLGSSNSTVSRISRYPDTTPKFRREVHAPCRIVKFGLFRSKNTDCSGKEKSCGNNMGNFLSMKYDSAKRSAMGAIRYLVKDKEVIDVDSVPEKPVKDIVVSEDSSIEEVEVIEEDGKEGRSMVLDRRSGDGVVGNEHDNYVKVVEERSVVTSGENLAMENVGKELGSLALNHEVEVLSVEAYKKLLETAERRTPKLTTLEFDIKYTEAKWNSLRLLRPVKKPDEKAVEVSCFLFFVVFEFWVFNHCFVSELE